MSVVEQNFVPLVAYSAMIGVTAIDGSCIKFGAATMSSPVMPIVSFSYTWLVCKMLDIEGLTTRELSSKECTLSSQLDTCVDTAFWHVSRSFLKNEGLPIREKMTRLVRGLPMDEVADEDLVKEGCS